MRIARIIEEFFDYRAYVSHTLWQHRLFLGLSSPKNAVMRLSDAAVWPLVLDEALKLASLSTKLFGIVSEPLEDVWKSLNESAPRLLAAKEELFHGSDDMFDIFKNEAVQFSRNLSFSGELLNKNTPEFSKEAVTQYLGRISFNRAILETRRSIAIELGRCIAKVTGTEPQSSDAYKEFWRVSSDAYLWTRKAIVASATENLPPEFMRGARELQKTIRSIEQIISCWSPATDPNKRADLFNDKLQAEGYASVEALISQLKGLELLDETHPGD